MKCLKIIAAVMAGFLICSCAGKIDTVQDDTVTVNMEGYPIVNKPITIRVMAPEWDNYGDFNEKQIVKEYEEKTNIHVEWILFNDSNIEEKFNQVLAEKNIPDVFLMMELPNMDYYGMDGVFLPVEDLIEQYAPNIKYAMEVDTESVKMCTAIDGHMYAVPSFYRAKSEELRGIPFINKKWLDQLNLPIPETPEALYEVLKAFKYQDPNGNGQQDEIPLLLDWEYNMTGVNSLFSPWGVSSAFTGNSGNSGPFVIKNDTEIVLSNTEEGYKEAVKYFHQLYEEGLLYNKSFSIESYMRNVLMEKGDSVGMITDYSPADKDFVPLLPLKGAEQGYMKQVYGIFANNYISAATKYPEAIMRWMNGTAEPEQSYFWNTGPLGVNVEKVDGKYRILPTPEGMTYAQFRAKETFIFPVMGLYTGWLEQNTILRNTAKERNEIVDTFKQYTAPPYTSFRTVDYLKIKDQSIGNDLTKLINYSKDKEVEFITRGNIDTEWEAHLAQMKALKADYIKNLYQDALNQWNETSHN